MKLKNEELIKEWEQLRLEAYLPTPNDVWTIGWGHTSTTKKGMVITKEEAQDLFEKDTAWAVRAVNREVNVGLSQNQFDALVSFVFNVGEGAFKKSTLLRKLNSGDYEGAANEFPKWNKQKGKVLKGLVRRRAHEQELFLSAVEEEPVPQKIDVVEPLKELSKSKELISGLVTVLTGVVGQLTNVNQTLLVASLIAFGAFVVWNRLKARSKGER